MLQLDLSRPGNLGCDEGLFATISLQYISERLYLSVSSPALILFGTNTTAEIANAQIEKLHKGVLELHGAPNPYRFLSWDLEMKFPVHVEIGCLELSLLLMKD